MQGNPMSPPAPRSDAELRYLAAKAALLIPGLDVTHPQAARWLTVMEMMEDCLKSRRSWSRVTDDTKTQLLNMFKEVPLHPDRRDEYERRVWKMKDAPRGTRPVDGPLSARRYEEIWIDERGISNFGGVHPDSTPSPEMTDVELLAQFRRFHTSRAQIEILASKSTYGKRLRSALARERDAESGSRSAR